MYSEVKPALDEGKKLLSVTLHLTLHWPIRAIGAKFGWIKTLTPCACAACICLFIDVPPEKVIKRLQRKWSVYGDAGDSAEGQEVYLKYVEKGDAC
jgi:hypothetical protein